VALDRAGEALALGAAADLDALARGERLHRHRVADGEPVGVADLDQVAVGGDAGALQVAELRP
jgi:hypothetical protein